MAIFSMLGRFNYCFSEISTWFFIVRVFLHGCLYSNSVMNISCKKSISTTWKQNCVYLYLIFRISLFSHTSCMHVLFCRHWHNRVNKHHLCSPGEVVLVPVNKTKTPSPMSFFSLQEFCMIERMNHHSCLPGEVWCDPLWAEPKTLSPISI